MKKYKPKKEFEEGEEEIYTIDDNYFILTKAIEQLTVQIRRLARGR
jgi:hypothetical protein